MSYLIIYKSLKNLLTIFSAFYFQKGSPLKPADFDYKMNYSYLNQVIPPTQAAVDEQSSRPVDLSELMFFL